jgi:Sel1 repeat protein
MEIVIAIIIGIAIVFIMMNFRNRKKMDEYDNFSRERENKNKKNDQETDNVDRFGHRVVSIDDIVEIDYSNNYHENDEARNEEYQKIIFYAYEDMFFGDFKRAKEKLERASGLSIKGNYELGKFYYYCKKDRQNAVSMFSFAYNDGVKEAAYYLGMIEEIEGNTQLALDWYNEGMKKGDINSTIRLGKIAEENKDYEKAEELYLKTIDTKDARIVYNLVNLYFKQNRKEKVVEWQKKLLNEKQITGLTFEIIKNIEFMLGNEKDKKYAELINQGNEFVKKRDYKNARKLFVESTNYNERGYLALAKSYYLEGNGEKTKETFEKAYELGVKEAAYEIGKYLDTVEKNEKEAEKWYKIGKEMGDARAIYALGMLYECNINFVKQDREEVNKLYEASADIKYAFGMEEMMYNNREKDEEKSKEWAFKILNESGLIELEEIIIKNVQDLLEELGENLDNKILTKDYKIEYDEDLIYFIQKKLGNPNFSSNYFSY